MFGLLPIKKISVLLKINCFAFYCLFVISDLNFYHKFFKQFDCIGNVTVFQNNMKTWLRLDNAELVFMKAIKTQTEIHFVFVQHEGIGTKIRLGLKKSGSACKTMPDFCTYPLSSTRLIIIINIFVVVQKIEFSRF